MQQRQLRLGDILDDYCTRERRVTNHAVVAMVGDDVKQTRCTTCDTEHEYKHAKVPRQRRKSESPAALYAQVAGGAPKRVTAPHAAETSANGDDAHDDDFETQSAPADPAPLQRDANAADAQASATTAEDERATENEPDGDDDGDSDRKDEEGPVHRPLIRASLPREGQPPPARPIPEFTIRQPGGRANRFRPRHPGHPGGSGQPFRGDRSNGNGFGGPGGAGGQHRAGPRHGGGRPPQGAVPSRLARRHGPGRKRQK
jgi:hypothetical protein